MLDTTCLYSYGEKIRCVHSSSVIQTPKDGQGKEFHSKHHGSISFWHSAMPLQKIKYITHTFPNYDITETRFDCALSIVIESKYKSERLVNCMYVEAIKTTHINVGPFLCETIQIISTYIDIINSNESSIIRYWYYQRSCCW